ncbi:GCN5-like N-acetyltransferase [Fictibacillus macauensis ZFHKF-1]|uniref:GCN5-like N-acetyltransferase n=1 Tax=Fictibacillus macauensis ZFHKF-1 TaxID=1196324 RepID=I8UIM8_9BACL|nr:GNAT family N-acetyltransferase [Fictibacillus macauensis]EIT86688.1 GCN5-like N-acetyltransferase [Fictibacillus macauensis ZFHKF-1]
MITCASQDDLEIIAQYTGQAMTEGTLGSYAVGNEAANSMMTHVLKNDGTLFVVKEDDKLAGWVLFGTIKDSITAEPQGFIYELFVFEHNRKKGYGKALLVACMEELRHQGLREVKLAVYEGNSALALYEQIGFTTMKRTMNRTL